MNADDRTRRAFDDLGRRAEHVDPHLALRRLSRSERTATPRRWVWALAGAAVVVAVVGGVAFLDLLPGTPDDDRQFVDTTTSTTTPTSTTVPVTVSTTTTGPTTTTTETVTEITRFRVNTALVAADVNDPFLNVRRSPGSSSPIVAKLPPTYSGVRWLGDAETATDGGTWYLVELLDPAPIFDLAEPLHGGNPVGFVNAAYIEQLPEGISVTRSDLPPCSGGTDYAGGSGGDAHISSLEVADMGNDCTRIVVGFSTGQSSFAWEDVPDHLGPVVGLPTWTQVQSPYPSIVGFPTTTSVWSQATDVDDVYVVRSPDGTLDLVSMVPAEDVLIRQLPDRGALVIDLRGGARSTPPAGANVALMRDVTVAGMLDVTGIARPFEANLEIEIRNAQGAQVEAVYSGSSFFGTIRTGRYAVQTNDWTEAWGRFSVRAEGLPTGDYTLLLGGQGGPDPARWLEVPFTITEAGEEPTIPSTEANDIARRFLAFALGSSDTPPFADTVELRLGDQIAVTRTRAQLTDHPSWVIDSEGFNAWSGPFDILRFVADQPNVRISEGQIRHCASPAIDWWPGAELVRPQINLEPVGIDSCIQWYAVTLRVNEAGVIQEVILDLWEP